MSTFNTGQQVRIVIAHNHLIACEDTIYTIGAINKVQGSYDVNLLKDGQSIGVIPESKLKSK